MSQIQVCDRCHVQYVKLFTLRELPTGWQTVLGTDLCENCSRLLHEFLAPLDQQTPKPEEQPAKHDGCTLTPAAPKCTRTDPDHVRRFHGGD